MSKGYIIAHPTLTNPEKFVSDYGSKVADVVEKYDGQFLVRGGNVSYREGDPADLNVVVEFPSLEKAMECINSPEYKAIEAGRKENMTGMFIVARHVIPRMQEAGGGSIINVSSIYGVVGAKERPAYCAAKGGVRMLSKSIAVDYAVDNIRANSIMPGPIETPRLLARNPSIEAVIDRHGPRLHQKRLGKPEEIAKTALFLASDDASFTSGADMVVDAAYTAF